MDIFEAIAAGDADRVQALLGQDPAMAQRRDAAGLSPVLAAQYRRADDLVQLVLAARPDLDIFDASATGDTARLAGLLDADPALVDASAPDGFFPLGLAAYFGRPAATQLLLDRGADVGTVARNTMRVQALHAAVAGRNTEVIRMLLDAGADPNARQHGGWTPLMAAAAHGDAGHVDLLLRHGAEPSAEAVAQAEEHGHPELAARIRGTRSTIS